MLYRLAEVVGIDPDAVPADETGREPQEIPLRSRRIEDITDGNADLVAKGRDLVHERDVHVALGVLHGLRHLGHLDARSFVDTGGDD